MSKMSPSPLPAELSLVLLRGYAHFTNCQPVFGGEFSALLCDLRTSIFQTEQRQEGNRSVKRIQVSDAVK